MPTDKCKDRKAEANSKSEKLIPKNRLQKNRPRARPIYLSSHPLTHPSFTRACVRTCICASLINLRPCFCVHSLSLRSAYRTDRTSPPPPLPSSLSCPGPDNPRFPDGLVLVS